MTNSIYIHNGYLL